MTDKSLTIEVDGESFHLGYSRISSYLSCPKKYKYSYIDRIPYTAGEPIRKGQAYHSVVEELLKAKQQGKEVSIERTLKYAKACAEYEQLTEWGIKGVIQAAEFYYHKLYPIHVPLEIESDFTIVRGGVKLTGRIDLVDASGFVIDHKFSYDIWSQDRAKQGVQPMIYQWAAHDVLEKRIPKFKYKGFCYNIIRVYPSAMIQELAIPVCNSNISDWWEEQVADIANAIRKGVFLANPKIEECKWCSYKDRCKPPTYRLKEQKHTDALPDGDFD